MARHAAFGGADVREYSADDSGDEAPDAAHHKLLAFERGTNGHAPRTRKISYVQRGPGGGGGGGGGAGAGRIADLVVLNEYDEDGNLAHKGTCIVKGVQRKFAAINPSRNPMTKNKDGSDLKVEMQYQIIDSHAEKPKRAWSAPRREKKEPLGQDPDDVPPPSEFPNKPTAVNVPPNRTRSEATSWMETHKGGNNSYLHRTAPRASSMISNFPVVSLDNVLNALDATVVDFESASKAHSAFKARDSFKERENLPMSRRRSLARQLPARQRVRHNPTVGVAQRAVPRVDKASPPASPRAMNMRNNPQHVRFETSDIMRLASCASNAAALYGAEDAQRIVYSPSPKPVHSPSRSPASHFIRPFSAPSRTPPKVPPLNSGLFAAREGAGAAERVSYLGEDRDQTGKVPSFGTPHVASEVMAPARRPPLHAQRAHAGSRAGGGAESERAAGQVTRALSAPGSTAMASMAARSGGEEGRVSARTIQAEKVTTMLRHVNAAHLNSIVNDKEYNSALANLEAQTNTGLHKLNHVVYIEKEGETGPSMGYEKPTCSTALKLNVGAIPRSLLFIWESPPCPPSLACVVRARTRTRLACRLGSDPVAGFAERQGRQTGEMGQGA